MSDLLSHLRVLVVDDEPSIRTAIVASLASEAAIVVAVGSSQLALEASRLQPFDVMIVDFRIGKDNGLELLDAILADAPWTKVIVITAFASFDLAVDAIRRGACNFLPKPFTASQLRVIITEAARQRRIEQQARESISNDDQALDFTSDNASMSLAAETARQVADTDATVLLRGETGTGKGELAKAIHQWSGRRTRPFGVISCPSLSAELLESELFGHKKGAFTNAVRDNPGRVAACDNGTLFLDEIGDLPLSLQPKLLRFIQDREYERVGDHQTRKADVRIVAATNVDLETAVKEGRFREDLLYRLNVIRIDVPPLRARPKDAVAIADKLVAFFARKLNKPKLMLSEAARSAIGGYAWPGNIRELRNVLERATILSHADLISAEILRLEQPPSSGPKVGGRFSLEQIEEAHIRAVLASTSSIEEASQVLGMDTVTLWRRRKRYGIQ